ncbi:ribonuclease H-like domain-containing protein [Tanacetum coccineum]|uniref:Ribonuclease H-like domain-containing protein n=1 Tax=Tanacetum coccineum TaxID=301880 RepID=A0ABQ4ZV98_9ASTR
MFAPKEVTKIVKSSFEKIEFVNTKNSTIEKPRNFSQNPRDNKRNRNGFEFTKKACFVCGSFNHLIKDCDFHNKNMVQKPVLNKVKKGTGQREVIQVWNNVMRVTHQNFSKRDFAPTAVLTKSGIPISAARQSSSRAAAPVSAARPINTDVPKPFVNTAKVNSVNTAKVNSVNTAKVNSVNTAKGNKVTSAIGPRHAGFGDQNEMLLTISPKTVDYTCRKDLIMLIHKADSNQGIFDSGCFRHMTRNKFYLSDYQDIDGGFVAFGGSSIRGKITGKGKISTGKLDFEDVYFVKELMFNLFSVSQMCDKKNSVLFTETKCLVVSPDFKLLDESQVLLKIPRQNNMYSFDLKNVVPSGDLTYPLGKFDGKADEGFLVRFSINSKAFRVFNTKTRKVEENLHITFLENKPNVAGSGPDWLFDIDLLTNSINYKPVTTGNQTNRNACIKDNVDAKPANYGLKEYGLKRKEGGASNKEGDQNVQDLRAELDNLLDTTDLLNTDIFSGAYDYEDEGAKADSTT